jgi:hypothetical protein
MVDPPDFFPEENANLDISQDIDYQSHFVRALSNDRVLKEGLLDCISYEPVDNARIHSILEKLEENSNRNLND